MASAGLSGEPSVTWTIRIPGVRLMRMAAPMVSSSGGAAINRVRGTLTAFILAAIGCGLGEKGWLGMLGDRYVNSDFWQFPFLTKTARTGPPTRYVPSGPGLTTPAGGTDKMRRSLHKLWEVSHPDVAEAEWLAFF